MSLKQYLEDIKIDLIKDDYEFMDAEYEAIYNYCDDYEYSITEEDLNTIRSRGLEESYIIWKQAHVKHTWERFREVPMNPETEKIETEWNGFPAGTHKEEIYHWFEEQFDISVAEDLME